MPPRKRTEKSTNHRLHHLLHHVGWSLAALEAPSVEKEGIWQLAPLPDNQALLLVFLNESLPRLDQAFKAYEDFSHVHRRLFCQVHARGLKARHGLLIDPDFRVDLIDLVQEEILAHARGESEVSEKVLSLLTPTALARGLLMTHPRKTPRQRARELDDWTHLWTAKLGAAIGASRDQAAVFFEWLHLTRLAEQLGVGPVAREPLARYGEEQRTTANPAKRLAQTWKVLAERSCLLQGSTWKAMEPVVKLAGERGVLLPCLESHGKLSRGKFSADLFAEAFSDEELRLIGWRHALVEKLPAPGDARDPAHWLTAEWHLDIDQVGYTGMLAAFNEVTEELRALACEQAVQRQKGDRTGVQLDLLAGEPPSLSEEEAPRIALQNVLRVGTQHRARSESARLVLLARTAEWFARLYRPEAIFPLPQIRLNAASGAAATAPPKPKAEPRPYRPELN